ncbi:hypothetical protein ACMGDK_11350 [Chryseobacterium sp. DT-3]|uniref:hypothetical protein n=1 Tax=Chryseobacterium sp. DT-3 TaxID=3396164 RepID=UPI003F1C9423
MNTEQDNLTLAMIIKLINSFLDGQTGYESKTLIINQSRGERSEDEIIFYIKKSEDEEAASEILLHIDGTVSHTLNGFSDVHELLPYIVQEYLVYLNR